MRAKKRRALAIRELPYTRLNLKFRHFVGCWASRMAVVLKSIRKELEKKTAKRRFLRLALKSWTPQLLKMRAKKRRALAIREPPNTRSGPTSLHMLIEKVRGSYMKEALGSSQYTNTCVPDSLLALFHILSIKYLHVQLFLMSNDLFEKLINTLNEEKYNDARELWIKQLPDFHKRDRFSNIKDHFTIVDKLVCAKVDYHQETPQNHPIYGTTLSKFRPFGDLRALGDIADPSVILVHRDVFNPRYDQCTPRIPPLAVTDDNKKKFELEVLLLGDKRRMHMHILFRLSENTWILYDNAWGRPFQNYDFGELYSNEDFHICLAIYVNTTQAEDYMNGVSATRGRADYVSNVYNVPFQQLSAQDVEMEDLRCSISVLIPEIRDAVGTKPLIQKQQERPVEDVEMLDLSYSISVPIPEIRNGEGTKLCNQKTSKCWGSWPFPFSGFYNLLSS